jgi:NNP family nitrate/nitrite transporter-like MFS transporter
MKSHRMLFLNTLAFTVCFAAWMFNGVLVTFLVDNQLFDWSPVQVGWLFGIPVLTGSLFRLPAGILTDKFGGRPVFGLLLLTSAIPMFLLSRADSFMSFAICSFFFGMTGVSFSIGIAFTSVWYPRRLQGTALGIFGAGNAGAALTTLFAPTLLSRLTHGGAVLEGWRQLPVWYAIMLAATGVAFFALAENKKPAASSRALKGMLEPLRSVRVWRFGLYYFLVFGCFVAFSQWLVPYFVNVYALSLVTAGIFAASFSFPSGVIRALGGWMSDRWGARAVMYWVLGLSTLVSALLIVPRMEIYSPGRGVMAKRAGVVTAVSPLMVEIDGVAIPLAEKPVIENDTERLMIWPAKQVWQEPAVAVGDSVQKKQLLARGVTRIYFQANVWIFASLVMLLGAVWGIGKAAVYKHIPDYFPEQVGVVGGMVGVLGGLGGFFCPIIFGYLLETTGLWTSCWMFMFLVSLVCLVWMHLVVSRMKAESPEYEAVRKLPGDFEVGGEMAPVEVRS